MRIASCAAADATATSTTVQLLLGGRILQGLQSLMESVSTYAGFAVCSGSSELPVSLSVPPGTAAGRRSNGCWNRGSHPWH